AHRGELVQQGDDQPPQHLAVAAQLAPHAGPVEAVATVEPLLGGAAERVAYGLLVQGLPGQEPEVGVERPVPALEEGPTGVAHRATLGRLVEVPELAVGLR